MKGREGEFYFPVTTPQDYLSDLDHVTITALANRKSRVFCR